MVLGLMQRDASLCIAQLFVCSYSVDKEILVQKWVVDGTPLNPNGNEGLWLPVNVPVNMSSSRYG